MILNVVLFQLGWFACVLGAASGYAREGAIAAALLVALHIARAAQPKREAMLAAAAATLGFLFESALVQAGWVRFEAGMLLEGAAPYWMVALWALFATTLNESMRMLQTRPWIAALLGAVGGPLAYYAGERLGAVEFIEFGKGLLAIGAGWFVLTPLLVLLAAELDGYAPQ